MDVLGHAWNLFKNSNTYGMECIISIRVTGSHAPRPVPDAQHAWQAHSQWPYRPSQHRRALPQPEPKDAPLTLHRRRPVRPHRSCFHAGKVRGTPTKMRALGGVVCRLLVLYVLLLLLFVLNGELECDVDTEADDEDELANGELHATVAYCTSGERGIEAHAELDVEVDVDVDAGVVEGEVDTEMDEARRDGGGRGAEWVEHSHLHLCLWLGPRGCPARDRMLPRGGHRGACARRSLCCGGPERVHRQLGERQQATGGEESEEEYPRPPREKGDVDDVDAEDVEAEEDVAGGIVFTTPDFQRVSVDEASKAQRDPGTHLPALTPARASLTSSSSRAPRGSI
ncbi:hypothetical protein B0H11DRAFT_2229590 [Mycena galericulata]|nr:hypothetical protein B0H11DRAFT_2229590 [Mycena galericulata]